MLGKYVSTAPGREGNAYKSFVLPPPCQRSISRELGKQEEASTHWGCRVWVRRRTDVTTAPLRLPLLHPTPTMGHAAARSQLHQTARVSCLSCLSFLTCQMQVIVTAILLGPRKVECVNKCLK